MSKPSKNLINKHIVQWITLGSAALAAAIAGCGGTTTSLIDGASSGMNGESSGMNGESSGMNGASSGMTTSGGPSDVSCAVAQVLAKCTGCHGSTPSRGAPMGLSSQAELLAPSKSDPKKSNLEVSIERMKDTSAPMPPSGLLAASETKVLEDWKAAGTKAEMCGTMVMPDPVGPDPYATPEVCTSKTMWNGRDGMSMEPGNACIQCHTTDGEAKGNRKAFKILGGTVYPSAHEPSRCNGVKDPVSVVITDADGKETTLPTNAVGNFGTGAAVKMPYTAKVVSAKGTRVMKAAQMSGDCNACHTSKGDKGAPGRIMAP
jgi:hypothetical protein